MPSITCGCEGSCEDAVQYPTQHTCSRTGVAYVDMGVGGAPSRPVREAMKLTLLFIQILLGILVLAAAGGGLVVLLAWLIVKALFAVYLG